MAAGRPGSDPAPSATGSFGRFWLAAAISSFGSAVTGVAMPVLVVQVLAASPLEVGVVNAAQLVPYALFGLFAGVYTDRWRRRPVLVWASVGRAVTLGAIPVLWMVGALQIWALVAVLLLFGGFSVFGFAATQSLLPRLVPRDRLVAANAHLDQTDTAAQTLGPALGGGLVGLLGAPVAIAVDAVSYVLDAVLNAGLRVAEPRPDRATTGTMRREIGEGVRFTYRHRMLAPLAVSTHLWFLVNGAAFTALSVITLRAFGLSGVVYGLLMAACGVTGLVGATIAPAVGRWLGPGPTVIWARSVYPIGWLLVALAPRSSAGVALLFLALALYGLAGGVENSNEMGYWQRVTPDGLLGRVNATRRSANRTAGALGAVIGGGAVGVVGDRATLLVVVVGFAVAALVVGVSPLRTVRTGR
jgi:MFS family permease